MILSEEHKTNISNGMKTAHSKNSFGFVNNHKVNLGRTHNEETKRKIGESNSIALKGKFLGDENVMRRIDVRKIHIKLHWRQGDINKNYKGGLNDK